MNRIVLVFATALALVLPSAAQAETAKVYFTKGEQLAAVKRKNVDGGVAAAVGALLAGPTAKERKAGYGTAIPAGVSLTNVVVRGQTVELTFSEDFATADASYLARVAQVVYTADAAGAAKIKIRGRTFTRDGFRMPAKYTAPKAPKTKLPAPKNVRAMQKKLAAIGYLPSEAVNGAYDYRTEQAVLAFQSWEGLERDGIAGPMTLSRLAKAGRPAPLDKSRARHVEIYRARGVVLLIEGGHAVRIVHTSTGIGGDSPDIGTPPGKWKIYRKEVKSWSVPYKTWLPYAAYWVGGWALHGYADVPAQPASHGCARLPLPEAKIVYDFVSIGTPVQVI
jgi:hypothetical protein